MANLQYVGARYVPKFYENSLDPTSCDWESGVGYEPLTVVTYSGDSYTSRKPVPGTVGDPAANPEYWAKTGEFNAAILALQGRMTDAEDRLDILENRKFIFIGDSYGNMTGSWIDNVISMLGLTSGNYFVAYENGAGLFMENGGGHTFADILAGLTPSIPDKDAITDIIIGGGVNDYYQSSGYINDSDAYSRLRTALAPFKNARCQIAAFGKDNHSDQSRFNRYLNMIWKYKNLSSNYGKGLISLMPNSHHIMSTSGDFESDGIHPTAAGSVRIAYGVVSGILSGDGQYFNSGSLGVSAAVVNDGFGQVGSGMFVMDGNNVTFVIPEFALNVYGTNQITLAKADNDTWLKICDFTAGATGILHNRSNIVSFPGHAIFAIPGESGWQHKAVSFKIDGPALYMRNDDGEAFTFERMRLYPVTVTVDRTNY